MRGLTYGLCLVATAAAMFACGAGESTNAPPLTPPAGTSTAPGPVASAPATAAPSGTTAAVAPPATNAATPPALPKIVVHGSAMQKDLEAIGFDVKKLPAFAKMDPVKRNKVMNTFTKSLGVKCSACHLENFKAETPNKKVARKMWDQWVVGLALEDNSFLYCDSCHQGHQEFLDKSDKKALSAWMTENLVTKIKRVDKKDHDCGTCHGDPFDGDFLSQWKKK